MHVLSYSVLCVLCATLAGFPSDIVSDKQHTERVACMQGSRDYMPLEMTASSGAMR
jgi:hypothetical protein